MNRGLGDHEYAEHAHQNQQRHRQVRGDSAGQRRTDQEPGQPPRPLDRGGTGAEIRHPVRDVHQPQRTRRESGPADQHPAAAVRIARAADQPPGRAEAEQRKRHRARADQEVQQACDNTAHRPTGMKPDRSQGERGRAKRGKPRAVPPVRLVDTQVTGAPTDPAAHPAQQRGRGLPGPDHQPDRGLGGNHGEGRA